MKANQLKITFSLILEFDFLDDIKIIFLENPYEFPGKSKWIYKINGFINHLIESNNAKSVKTQEKIFM